jgi:hypothetical protein
MDINSPESSAPTSLLSNQTLQAAKTEHEAKQQERLKNGIIPCKQHKVSKRLDDLTHRLVIEQKGVMAAGTMCGIYYCIGCDKESRNNACTRSLCHMYGCDVSICSL